MDSVSNIPENHKRCIKCNQIFPSVEKYFQRRANGKLRNACRNCQKAYYRQYYQKNRERLLAQAKVDYYKRHEHHLQKAAEGRKKYAEAFLRWRQDHRQHLREYTAQWRQDNPHRELWSTKNRKRARVIKARYRANKKQAEGEYNKSDIDRIFRKQRGYCLYCGTELDDSFHIDHFIPLSRAGWNSPDNLALACHSCNSSKNDSLPYEWYKWNGKFPSEWKGRLI